MVLFSFHYAVTAFFLATWWHSVLAVMIVHFAFQGIYYAAGASVSLSQEGLFWGWQALASGLGAMAGFNVARERILLFTNWYSWIYFLLSLAAFLGAQLFYAFYPPLSTLPAGQAGVGVAMTFILTILIVLFIWYGNSREKEPWGHYLTWAFLFGLLELLFYISLSGLAEIWVSFIAGGATLVAAILIRWCLCITRPLVYTVKHVRRGGGTSFEKIIQI